MNLLEQDPQPQPSYPPEPVKHKFCPKCKTPKPVDAFSLSSHRSDGTQTYCKSCQKAIRDSVKHTYKHKSYHREYSRKKLYGMMPGEYDRLLAEQDGKCKSCGGGPDSKYGRLYVDHDHATGRVRGLLCSGCNTALGCIADNIDRLRNLIVYLEDYSRGCESVQILKDNNTSGHKGVHWNKQRSKWDALITVNKKRIELGSFRTAEEAGAAYRDKSIELFGIEGYRYRMTNRPERAKYNFKRKDSRELFRNPSPQKSRLP